MEILIQKQFEYELKMFMNIKDVTFCNFERGSLGQKCYYFLTDKATVDSFNMDRQISYLFNRVPTNQIPVSYKEIGNDQILIIEYFNCDHNWSN